MAAKTFMASNLFNEFTLFHPELPLTALAGQPDLARVGAAWVLWNESASNQKVTLKNIKLINQMSQDNVLGISTLLVKQISSYTSGSMTDTVANITPMDSNNTAIPAQVKILSRVDTVNTGTTLKRMMNMASNLNTRTIPLRCSKNYGKSSTNSDLDHTIICNPGEGDSTQVQQYVLREGQGIAISPEDVQVNIAYRFSITFNVGSQTWMAGETLRPFSNMTPMIIFNESGSGVVISIVSISMYEIGEDNMPYFAVQRIEGVFPDLKGIDVTSTVVPMDSNEALPSGIKMYEDCIVNLAGVDVGAVIANPSYRRQTLMWVGSGPTWAIGTRMYGMAASQDILDVDVVLRPNEGIALLQKNNTGMGRYGASVCFQTEAISTGGGTHSIASVG